VVGVEIRQRHKRQHFAGRHVEHQARRPHRPEARDRGLERAAQDVLDADIERQRHRCAGHPLALGQLGIQCLLDAGQSMVVDARETNHVRGQYALGVDPPILVLKADAR